MPTSKKKKKEVTVEELCKDQPEEFKEFMHYVRGLSFTQDPDYSYMIGLFESCLKRQGFNLKPLTSSGIRIDWL